MTSNAISHHQRALTHLRCISSLAIRLCHSLFLLLLFYSMLLMLPFLVLFSFVSFRSLEERKKNIYQNSTSFPIPNIAHRQRQQQKTERINSLVYASFNLSYVLSITMRMVLLMMRLLLVLLLNGFRIVCVCIMYI